MGSRKRTSLPGVAIARLSHCRPVRRLLPAASPAPHRQRPQAPALPCSPDSLHEVLAFTRTHSVRRLLACRLLPTPDHLLRMEACGAFAAVLHTQPRAPAHPHNARRMAWCGCCSPALAHRVS